MQCCAFSWDVEKIVKVTMQVWNYRTVLLLFTFKFVLQMLGSGYNFHERFKTAKHSFCPMSFFLFLFLCPGQLIVFMKWQCLCMSLHFLQDFSSWLVFLCVFYTQNASLYQGFHKINGIASAVRICSRRRNLLSAIQML